MLPASFEEQSHHPCSAVFLPVPEQRMLVPLSLQVAAQPDDSVAGGMGTWHLPGSHCRLGMPALEMWMPVNCCSHRRLRMPLGLVQTFRWLLEQRSGLPIDAE